MHERPIGDLVDALRQLGCRSTTGPAGLPAAAIGQPALQLDRPIPVRGDVSSQFLTALLMALPLAAAGRQDIVIEVVGELISKPYIDITLLLARFGIAVQRRLAALHHPAGSRYRRRAHPCRGRRLVGHFIALAPSREAKTVRIEGVGWTRSRATSASSRPPGHGRRITGGPTGCRCRGAWPLKAIDLDCNHIPDAAMTLAVMALYADGPPRCATSPAGASRKPTASPPWPPSCASWAPVEEGPDFIRITRPPRAPGAASIHTYDDHRVAMCFSLAAFNPAGLPVRIEDPCVAKTFPTTSRPCSPSPPPRRFR
jgi:3-phosphoshikimate 1-carboxyvinyltransferase